MTTYKKEALLVSQKRKDECNSKAQKVVLQMIDGVEDEEHFLEQLQWINQTHYQDITEERAIVKICGYPVCTQPLGVVPKKKYHISVTQNKVYDITERKLFCSNQCYKASTYLKKQLHTSPLWFRDRDECKAFTLLKSKTELLGQEVDFVFQRVEIPQDLNISENIASREFQGKLNHRENFELGSKPKNETQTANCDESSKLKNSTDMSEKLLKLTLSKSVQPERIPKKNSGVVAQTISDLINHAEQSLKDWMTIDTLCCIMGDQAVTDLLRERGHNFDLNARNKKDSYLCKRYNALCKKLKILELEDKKQDDDSFEAPTKPLPDFNILKEQTKEIEIKVKAFYRGDQKVSFAENKKEANSDSRFNVLPPLHQHSQNVVRRNLVLNKLQFVLPDICHLFELNYVEIKDKVKKLVYTCRFSAQNITFKPLEWNLIALILLQLLSVGDGLIRSSLEYKSEFVNALLEKYHLKNNYLERFIGQITDLDLILKNETTS